MGIRRTGEGIRNVPNHVRHTLQRGGGRSPLTYLLNWRILLAQRALRDGTSPISGVAQSVGYTSESAFSNAFKRVKGLGPKRYRDTLESGTNSPNSWTRTERRA
jgi:AraC-like DNA-binding protein